MHYLTVSEVPDDNHALTLSFKQPGMPGFLLTVYVLPEFLDALDNIPREGAIFFWENLGLTKSAEKISVFRDSGKHQDLLYLDLSRAAKLRALLKTKYSAYL